MSDNLNKPRYSFIKNAGYALDGFLEIFKNETSFKIQITLFVFLSAISFILPIEFYLSSILFLSLFIPIIAEVINSAIERTVDLVTSDYNILAKQAKDAGATIVFLSLLLTFFIWFFVLIISL